MLLLPLSKGMELKRAGRSPGSGRARCYSPSKNSTSPVSSEYSAPTTVSPSL